MKTVLVAMLCLASSVVAHAQFGGLGKKDSGGTVTAAQVALKYTAASKLTFEAQARLLDAFDLKQKAVEAEAEANNMDSGPVADSKKAEEVSRRQTENFKALSEEMAKKPELSPERKAEFVKGAALLAGATAAYTAAALDAKGYKPSGIPDAEARLAIAIAKQLPTDMKTLKEAIGAVVAYAKENNISMPSDLKVDI